MFKQMLQSFANSSGFRSGQAEELSMHIQFASTQTMH